MGNTKFNILVPVEVVSKPQTQYKSTASLSPVAQPDLLYMKSLLVSTGANKNDDVFLPEEMWRARSSPVLKPVDWEHNTGRELTEEEQANNPGKIVADNQIIGVMYNAYATDKNGVIISEDKSSAVDFEIPEDFHIVDEAVIFKGLYPKAAARIEKGASDGSLFVSMEAWFSDYDYLVGNKVVARNEETAFLERSLRANGGNGTFGHDSVKRVLKNLCFGGKGIVEKPANEPSIIQSVTHEPISASSKKNKAIANNIICGFNLMEDEMPKEAQEIKVTTDSGPSYDEYRKVVAETAELKGQLKTTSEERDESKSKAEGLESQLDNAKSAISKGAAALEVILPGVGDKLKNTDVSEVFDVIADAVTTSQTELKEKLEAAEKKATEAQDKLSSIEADIRAKARLEKVQSELGLAPTEGDEEAATKAKLAQAQKFADETKELDDEAFASKLEDMKGLLTVARGLPPFMKKKKEEEDEKKKKKAKSGESEVDEAAILDSVKASQHALAAGDDTSSAPVDLEKAYGGLVTSMLNANKPADKSGS